MPSLKNKLKKNAKSIVLILVLVFIFLTLLISGLTSNRHKILQANENGTGLFGLSGTEKQIYNKYIESQIGNFSETLKQLQTQLSRVKTQNQTLSEQNKLLNAELLHINNNVDNQMNKRLSEAMNNIDEKISAIIPSQQVSNTPIPQSERLQVITISQKNVNSVYHNNKELYLPAGSFVKGTLLSGVFAPENQSNPLPVVFSVDEAFNGPADSKIPLKGMLGIGKAEADLNSSRAIIQVVRLAYVFPNGQVWEKNVKGWVCDQDGILGVKGLIVQQTGKALAGAFLSGFLSGTSQALSQAETTTQQTTSGTFETNVTGNTTKYGLYSGLSSAAGNLSNYYSGMLNQIITAVKVKAGTPIQIIMETGVAIKE